MITITTLSLIAFFIFYFISYYSKFIFSKKYKRFKENIISKKINALSYWKEREFLCNITYRLETDYETLEKQLQKNSEIKIAKGECKFLKVSEKIKKFKDKNFKNINITQSKISLIFPIQEAKKILKFKDFDLSRIEDEEIKNYLWISEIEIK